MPLARTTSRLEPTVSRPAGRDHLTEAMHCQRKDSDAFRVAMSVLTGGLA